jgi:hypothetical protein
MKGSKRQTYVDPSEFLKRGLKHANFYCYCSHHCEERKTSNSLKCQNRSWGLLEHVFVVLDVLTVATAIQFGVRSLASSVICTRMVRSLREV